MHDYDLIIAPIISLSSIAIGIIIYLNDRNSSPSKVVAIISSSIGLWILSAFFSDLTKDWLLSLLLNRFTFVAIISFMSALLYLPFVFPIRSKIANNIKLPLLIFSILFGLVTMATPFLIANIEFLDWGSNLIYGKYFMVFAIYTIIAILITIVKFIISYIKLKGEERSKIRLFFTGLILVSLINIFVQVILRNLVGSDEFYRFGNYSVVIFIAYTAYAIVKHQLFNVRVILTEIAVAIVNFAILEQIFLSRGVLQISVNIVLFLLVAFGSYMLVISVIREIKQKEDLAKFAGELKVANEHLKELDKLKDDFLSMAAHELNTPLAAITGYLSMILDEHIGGEVNPKIQKYLENMFISSKRLSLLIKDMLNVSRIESGRIHLIFSDTPIESVIEQAIAEIGSKAKERNQSLIFHKPKTKMPKTWYDASRVTEVLLNIIGNAIKYTDSGGKIDINVKNDDKFITVSVKDNGRGIPEDRKEAVFEKFSQVDVLKDEVKGTGLGMYIAKKFIELLGGRIWFDSEEGKGSTFYFTLPILKDKPRDPHEGEGKVLH